MAEMNTSLMVRPNKRERIRTLLHVREPGTSQDSIRTPQGR